MPGPSDERPSRAHKLSPAYRAAQHALGARVRELRQGRGWTLQQAAERMDLDWKHLQKIEGGTLNLTLVTLVRITEGLGEPLASLFAPTAPTTPSTKAATSSTARKKPTRAKKSRSA